MSHCPRSRVLLQQRCTGWRRLEPEGADPVRTGVARVKKSHAKFRKSKGASSSLDACRFVSSPLTWICLLSQWLQSPAMELSRCSSCPACPSGLTGLCLSGWLVILLFLLSLKGSSHHQAKAIHLVHVCKLHENKCPFRWIG
jgi:hypothetical protein